jgi:Fis family transcriptional regulator, factor for inversion stimulation protein
MKLGHTLILKTGETNMSSMYATIAPAAAETVGLREHLAELLLTAFNRMEEPVKKDILKEVEAALYQATMTHMHGNQSRGSKFLGVSRGTLRTKLKEYFGTTQVGI